MADWGSVPQWVTAGIAGAAIWIAWKSINSQREIARKRAALDFFAKTEMDKELLIAHGSFTAAIKVMENHLQAGGTFGTFVSQFEQEYWKIRSYLNLHELMATGIKRNVLDDDVCYDFWSGELFGAYVSTKDLIMYIQTQPDEDETYCELIQTHNEWRKRASTK